MKIIILGSAFPLRGGGITTFNERLADELGNLGHDVQIFSFSLQYPSILFPGKSQYDENRQRPHVRVQSLINSINPVNWMRVGKRCIEENADIIIVRFWIPLMAPCLGTILRMVRKKTKTKVICIADNIHPHEGRLFDRILTSYFIKSVDSFLVMSQSVLKELQSFTNKPITHSPHPLYDVYGQGVAKEKACESLQLDPDKKYVLFFGFIRKYKGLDLLLRSFKELSNIAPSIHLIVAGEFYMDEKPFLNTINKNGLQSKVHLFNRFINDDEIKLFFSAASVVVLPYRSGSQSGVTQLAFHFHRPVIATNVGGISEVVMEGKTGLITEPNPEAITRKITTFFSTYGNGTFWEQNISRLNQYFTWKYFVRNLLASHEEEGKSR